MHIACIVYYAYYLYDGMIADISITLGILGIQSDVNEDRGYLVKGYIPHIPSSVGSFLIIFNVS